MQYEGCRYNCLRTKPQCGGEMRSVCFPCSRSSSCKCCGCHCSRSREEPKYRREVRPRCFPNSNCGYSQCDHPKKEPQYMQQVCLRSSGRLQLDHQSIVWERGLDGIALSDLFRNWRRRRLLCLTDRETLFWYFVVDRITGVFSWCCKSIFHDREEDILD